MWNKLFVLALLGAGVLCEDRISYQNYKVHKVTPHTQAQVEALRNLEERNAGFSFWSDIQGVGKPVHIMVPPHQKLIFQDILAYNKLEEEVYMEDVQKVIDSQAQKKRASKLDFTNYYRLEQIYDHLDELAAKYPQVNVVTGGKSYEGREIRGIHISYSPNNANKTVFIEAGIHAREWISPATVLYAVNEFLTSDDPTVRRIAESHDFYVFPVYNPDGYEYTFDKDRLWRKTRQPYPSGCVGADPNRNWGFHWMDGGASSFECSETFAGSSAFSEPETKSMSEFITSVKDNVFAYISFHSFSQLLLIPYGHSPAHVENYDELERIGFKAADKLAERYGTRYTVGNIVETIYVASGGSMDWVKGTHGTPITYTYELRDTGRYGFLLPAEQIIPTGEETLDSLLVILDEASK